MSLAKLGLGLLTIAGAVVEGQARQQEHTRAMDLKREEDNEWEKRRNDAYTKIDKALEVGPPARSYVSASNHLASAQRLKNDVDKYCRERSVVMMKYTEDRIARFVIDGLMH
jgi:hypothetical protein